MEFKSASTNEPLQLNNYDKLYLLMSKWKLLRLFNPLCYAGNITSIEDLESQIKANSAELSENVQGFDGDLSTMQTMIEDSKTVKFEDLPLLLDIPKNDYEEQLNAAGVRIIPRDHLTLQRKIALNRPYSGDVFRAQWTQQQNDKIDVVLRYDLGPSQQDLFIREAKIMTGLHHEYIMKFYGAVVLGPYAHSVGLVVERFSVGNLEEFAVPSLFHAWLFASQLSSALEYLETRSLVHTSVVEPFIYISSHKKISLGGFMCCYLKEETDRAREPGHQRDLLLSAIHVTGHQSRRLDDLSGKGVVAMFSQVVTSMFRYLDSHLSRELLELFPGDKKMPLVCPRRITSLMDRCMAEDVGNRPSFEEIVQILAEEKPATYCFTTSHSSVKPCELSFVKGERVWVISQDASRYHGMWLGQKENRNTGRLESTGFFESTKAIKIDDDNDQVPLEIRARGIEAELAYRNALLEGKVELCRARLLIIGQDRAGKTSLKKSLIGLPFNQNEPSTEVVEVNQLQFEVTAEQVVEWKSVNVGDKEHARPEDRRVARLVAEHMSKKNKTEEKQVFPGEEKKMVEERVASEPTQVHARDGTSRALSQNVLPQHASRQDSIPVPQDSVDGFQERAMQKPNIAMPKELTPLVTECLRNLDTPNDGNSARETLLDIWDFAGQHLYYATHPLFFSHRAVYLLVHNLSRNLCDLAEPSFKQGEHTKPKLLKNISDETNLDMLLSWLVSIHSIRQPPVNESFVEDCKSNLRCLPPPVLLVGTHKDRVSLEKVKEVESEIISSLKGKTYQEHVLPDFYNVDNTMSSDSPGVKNIKARVQQILSSGLSSSADLPVKWFNFEKAVKDLSAGTFYLTLDEIRDLARQECFIENEKQLDAMLNYYHDLGVIVRFQDTVVIDTQWLINLFKKLITVCPYREQDPVDRKLWEELGSTGVLDMQLINKVFEKNLHCNESKSLQQDILDMMEMYGFVARFHPQQESNTESRHANSCKYFVPAQLSISAGELWTLATQDTDPHPLVFKFCDGFVPHGLFPQLVSRLIGRSSELECMKIPKLYCDGVRFFLGKRNEFDLILLCSKRSIKLALKCYGSAPPDTQQGTVFSLPINVRILIEDELSKLCGQWHWLGNVRYEVCVVCWACQRSKVKCQRHNSPCCVDLDCQHLLPISDVEPNTLMSCPEQVGDHSRFTLIGLNKWFPSAASEESPAENECALAKVSDVNILELAGDITCHKWKVIGRLLGLEDTVLNQIEMNKPNDVLEQCYEMLNSWKRKQKSDATCEQLKYALSHKLVMKNDLVPRYCYLKK